MATRVWPGKSYPLGAVYDGAGTNFAIFSEVAEQVELCLFDEQGREERVELPEMTGFVWHGYVVGIAPGQRYGFRVHAPWAPERGVRGNPSKLLLDPYARAIEGRPSWGQAVYPYRFGEPDARDDTDSAPSVPRSIVVGPTFDWGNDRPPGTPWHETIVYELHVKGFTAQMESVPAELRGTYAGLAHPAAVKHLVELGVTAVELLPVHQFVHSQALVEKQLRNYWGYDSIGFFAPHNEYSSSGQRGQQVIEFKQMVKALHAAGIEVLLDVVYNHTCEGNHLGPVLAFKGVDNCAYYRTAFGEPRHYMDYTGTGNTLNMRHPHVLQLIMDSLRYWILEMHVDGFRFDLAATLARGLHDVDRLSAFFDLIQQDPVVRQAKLIAEPWDVGEGGYQVGNFPTLWSEWNGKFRDVTRDYWRGEDAKLGELANRFTGSSDLYASTGRRPYASVNFVTAHDGFTLEDLVSYNGKHNEANGEDNRDGESHNRSWNCGAEGPTDDPTVRKLRDRQKRNLLATLILSQGVPMICGGDEIGRTQGGNNNAYCQDNPISWLDWSRVDEKLLAFVQRLTRLRRDHKLLHRRRWFQGRPIHGHHGAGLPDIGWHTPDGSEMEESDWGQHFAKSLGIFMNGAALGRPDQRGERVPDDSFFIVFNAHYEELRFTVPLRLGRSWAVEVDTADEACGEGEPRVVAADDDGAGAVVLAAGRSLLVLRRVD